MVVWLYGCTIERDPYECCILIELWFRKMCLIERYFQGIKIGLCRPPSIYWPPALNIRSGRPHYCGRAPTFSHPYPHSLLTLPSLPLLPYLFPALPMPIIAIAVRRQQFFQYSLFTFPFFFVPLQQTFRKTKAEMNNNNTDPTPCPSP